MTEGVKKEDIPELWAQALESGKYPQTQAALYRHYPTKHPAGYCCLGVLTRLFVEEKEGIPEGGFYKCGFDLMFLPPHRVTDWAGFTFANMAGRFKEDERTEQFSKLFQEFREDKQKLPNEEISLAELNDWGVDFPTIAEIIRARPTGLFREEEADYES